MSETSTPEIPTIESIERQFVEWRRTRVKKREPIPSHLWQAAAELCRTYPITRVCQRLHISFTELKKRVAPRIKSDPPFLELCPGGFVGQWHLECERPDGIRLRMAGHGATPDIDTILRRFLS